MNTCVRYFYQILNVLFITIGLVLVAFGVYVLVGSPIHELLINISGNMVLIYAMIILGSVIFLVGSCGALGSCYENRCLLIIYLCFNVVFLLAQVGFVIFTILEKDSIKNHLSTVWSELNNETKYLIQERFSCCGYASHDEWGDGPEAYPESCMNSTSESNPTAASVPWSVTCYDSIVGYVDENIIWAGAIAGCVLLIQGFQMVVTCLLIREYHDKNRVHDQSDTKTNHVDTLRVYDTVESEEASFDGYLKHSDYQESRLNYHKN